MGKGGRRRCRTAVARECRHLASFRTSSYTAARCRGRLLGDLQRVESTLAFWQRQLQRGSHVRFMLFQRGPVHFAAHVGMGLKALLALLSPPGLSSQQRRDEEDDDEGGAAPPRGRPPDRSQAVERTTSVGPGGARSLSSATTRMQRRVLLLEALRNILAETLAQVRRILGPTGEQPGP